MSKKDNLSEEEKELLDKLFEIFIENFEDELRIEREKRRQDQAQTTSLRYFMQLQLGIDTQRFCLPLIQGIGFYQAL